MTRCGVLFILGIFVYLETRILVEAVIGTALYCRDPDTGKLHAPNTTWPSTTFCGNYACRLKKKNESTIEYKPNAPKNDNNDSTNKVKTKEEVNNLETKKSNSYLEVQEPASARKDNSDKTPELYKTQNNPPEQKESTEPKIDGNFAKPSIILHENTPNIKLRFQLSKLEDALGDNDRYLSEDEIKIISDLLYTVKKSDLEAIVDIYNLAQDIYNEMERPPSDDIIGLLKNKEHSEITKPYIQFGPAVNKNSYWYEPLQNEVAIKSEIQEDLNFEASDLVLPSAKTILTTTLKPQAIKPKLLDDFRKLPYDIPASNFQDSFLQVKTAQPFTLPQGQYGKKPTVHTVQSGKRVYAPLRPQLKTPEKIQVPTNNNIPEAPILLPYPFSHVRYNISSAPNTVYYGMNPYSIDLNKNNQNMAKANPQPQISFVNPLNVHTDTGVYNQRNSLAKFLTAAQWPTNQNVPDKMYLIDNKLAANKMYAPEQKFLPEYAAEYKYTINPDKYVPQIDKYVPPIDKYVPQIDKYIPQIDKYVPQIDKYVPQIDKTAAWLTDPLPEQVIEAIRAKIQSGNRPYKSYFPSKRMVQIENNGRIKKHNVNRNRKKRDESFDDYEAVVEKNMCTSDDTPGFFRKGNESEPFPKCCPQRIEYKLLDQKENSNP